MATKLVLVRHGQTPWNKEERFRGRSDLPLDESGLQQAHAVAEALAGQHQPSAVYSSPLQRAMSTAAPIGAALSLSVQSAPALLDIDYGRFSGLTPEEAKASHPGLYRAWLAAPHTLRFPEGESLSEVRARAADFLWQTCRAHPQEELIFVTHLVVCRVLACYLLGLPESSFWRFEFGTASISAFLIEDGAATLLKANDTSHLAEFLA